MTTRQRLASIIAIIISLCYIPGCSRLFPDPLVGKWIRETPVVDTSRPGVANMPRGSFIEFMADGTLILGTQSIKYRSLDKNRLSIEGFGEIAIIYEFTLNGDQLTLNDGSEPWQYARVGR